MQIQKAQKVPKKINLKIPTPSHIITKYSKLKTYREC